MATEKVLELVIATRENTKNVGWLVDDEVENPGLGIPFYKTVVEGANYEHADWKDSACVRTSKLFWRADHRVSWLERHMEMTQGFICVGAWHARPNPYWRCTQGTRVYDPSIQTGGRRGRRAPTGRYPGLFVFGEPTHDRLELDEAEQRRPDPATCKVPSLPQVVAQRRRQVDTGE